MPFFPSFLKEGFFFSQYFSLKYANISDEVLGTFLSYDELCISLANRNIIEGIR